MKRLIIIAIGLLFIFQACYEDYKYDYLYTSTYFAVQNPLKTVVMEKDKDVSFEVGVMLGGKYKNDQEWTVDYEIDPSMLDDVETLNLLPSDYYTLSDEGKFIIKEGEYLGTITVTLNSKFFNDTLATKLYYALPLRITNSTTDSILSDMDSTIVAIKFQNRYYGAYWVKGVDNTLNASGNVNSSSIYTNADLVLNKHVTFKTLAKNISVVPHVGSVFSDAENMNLTIDPNGSVSISTGEPGNFSEVNGEGKYNMEEGIFTLDYSYLNGSEKHHVMDTLIYFDTPMSQELW